MNATHTLRLSTTFLILTLLSLATMPASAQVYDLSWHTIDGGGFTSSTGGGYTLAGTIGQPDANGVPLTGGSYELTGGFWAAAHAVLGDLDNDCDVDVADLALMLSSFGCTGGGCVGDFDHDDDVDVSDLALLLSNFGTICP